MEFSTIFIIAALVAHAAIAHIVQTQMEKQTLELLSQSKRQKGSNDMQT